MKKIIINETQYNRLFNKPKKQKVIITESQLNLIVEANMTNTIQKIESGDVFTLVDKKRNELNFKVVLAFSGLLLMINCNEGVYKNMYFLISTNSLNNSQIGYRYIHESKLEDKSSLEKIVKTSVDWSKSTWKNIDSIQVFEGDSQDITCNLNEKLPPKFNVDVNTGEIVKPEPEKDTAIDSDTEGNYTKELLEELFDSKVDNNYQFKLSDDSNLTFLVVGKNSEALMLSLVSASGNVGDRYKDVIDYDFELTHDVNNLNVKLSTNSEDDKDVVLEYFDMKLKKYEGGEGEDGSVKHSDIVVRNIVDFSMVNKDEGEGEFIEFTDEELDEYFKEFINNSQLLKDALWKKPNKFLEAVGVAKERGILPAEDIIGKWVGIANKNILFSEFKPGEKEYLSMIAFKPINPEETRDFYSGIININEKYLALTRKRDRGNDEPVLSTNFNADIKSFLKYKLIIKKQLEKSDKFSVYYVDISYREKRNGNYINIGEGKVKIFNDNNDKDGGK